MLGNEGICMMDKITKIFRVNAVAIAVLTCMSHAFALQEMSEGDLRSVDGQDGVHTEVSYSSINIDQIYWQDQAGLSTGTGEQALRGTLNNVTISRGSVPVGTDLGVVAEVNVGSKGDVNPAVGMDLNVKTRLGKIEVATTKICQSTGCTANDKTMGKLTIDSTNQNTFHLTTSNGLFNTNAVANLELGLKNIDIGLEQQQTTTTKNTLLMRDFNFNFLAQGNIYVDPVEGMVLRTDTTGYVDFSKVKPNNSSIGKSGLNLEFMLKDNAGNEMGIIRAGANGRIINGILQFRGVSDTDAASILGYANRTGTNITTGTNSIAGSSGIAFKLVGEFTNDKDNLGDNVGTTLELGGAGNFAYGLRFANITPLVTRKSVGISQANSLTVDSALNTDRAGLDTGNIYLNLVDAHQITMPISSRLTGIYMGDNSTSAKVPLVTSDDFNQTIANTAENSANPYSVVLSIRDMNFSALSRRSQFIASDDVTGTYSPDTSQTKWGLGLPIYGLNSNFAFYGKTSTGITDGDYIVSKNSSTGLIATAPISGSERIGFSGAISTKGVNDTGDKSTSILLIDGGANANAGNSPTDYYVGLRNIDMLLNGYGSVGLENGQVNISMPKILLVMSAQIAGGYLPGAKYKTCANTVCYAPSDNFLRSTDVLAGIKVRLGGSINMAIIPRPVFGDQTSLVDGANKLGFIGIFTLDSNTTKNSIQIIDPVDSSTLGLDNLSGTLAFDNSIAVNKNSAGFNLGLNFNPNKNVNEVFRIKDVNFYPSNGTSVGAAQRLGEVAITGGRLSGNMTLTPRDGAFTF